MSDTDPERETPQEEEEVAEAGAPPAPEPALESDGDILVTAEPFHPARDPDGDADAPGAPLAALPDPDAALEEEAAATPPPAGPEAPPGVEPELPQPVQPTSRAKGGPLARLLRAAALVLLIVLVIGPVAATLVYRVLPPPLTSLMIIRLFEGHGLDRRWRSLSQISPNLTRAVIGAEDARFCEHHGFDFEAMRKAYAHNEKGRGRVRGGSTISQQTAKNIFLWPDRSYVRKGFEAWFTVLIETIWGKRRIMEVYLNSIEWGPGIYGAEAAARANFGVSAAALNQTQAARLAAILPRPLKWQADTPGRYVARRSARIGAAEGTVDRDNLDSCVE